MPSDARTVLSRSPHGAWIVIVERTESVFWERFNDQLRAYVDAVEDHCSLDEQEDFHAPDGGRLRMWKVESCR